MGSRVGEQRQLDMVLPALAAVHLQQKWSWTCRYLREDVKMNAINDGLILEAQIYVLLKRYFGTDAEYVQVRPTIACPAHAHKHIPELRLAPFFSIDRCSPQLMELMHETTYQTALGQFLDLTNAEPHKVDFSLFSMEVYSKVPLRPMRHTHGIAATVVRTRGLPIRLLSTRQPCTHSIYQSHVEWCWEVSPIQSCLARQSRSAWRWDTYSRLVFRAALLAHLSFFP